MIDFEKKSADDKTTFKITEWSKSKEQFLQNQGKALSSSVLQGKAKSHLEAFASEYKIKLKLYMIALTLASTFSNCLKWGNPRNSECCVLE